MKIVVEPSDYYLKNAGDAAMLGAALSRLSSLLPAADLQVFNDDPEGLDALGAQVRELDIYGRRTWLDDGFLPAGAPLAGPAAQMLRRVAPGLIGRLWELKLRGAPQDRAALQDFLRTIRQADALLVTGMGGITDAFPEYAAGVLQTLALALDSGVRPVAMLGQGFGPLHDPALHDLARRVLPRLSLIGVREKRLSVPLLHELGVPEDRIVVTGDDALELALGAGERPGDGLGVNLRLAAYSGVTADMTGGVRRAVSRALPRLSTYAVPIPISRTEGEEDLKAIAAVTPIRAELMAEAERARVAADVIALVARCRVVVTGSYHAAVFALASGRPAVCLVGSDYYGVKFHGLADMFGAGCEVLAIDDPMLADRLGERLDRLWATADDLHDGLVTRAQTQVEAGRRAYDRLRAMIVH